MSRPISPPSLINCRDARLMDVKSLVCEYRMAVWMKAARRAISPSVWKTHQCPSILVKTEEPKPKPKPSASTTKSFKLARKKPPTDPVQLAQWQKMEVMKMRHRAVPADPKDKAASLPPDQRLHVRVMVGEKENIFWFVGLS
ncbi:hypothetical protein BJ912DRAFT_72401 [Pholiota molesta]|nr:hypothetical protein BJ912DRAFT_72401 [Pholiota molesta]